MTNETESDFGKGLCYCLGMFLAHAERANEMRQQYKTIGSEFKEMWAMSWFNGASDHLYEMEIPDSFAEPLRKRLAEFQDKCLEWGHGCGIKSPEPITTDVDWAIGEAKELLRLIDEQIGIATITAKWN